MDFPIKLILHIFLLGALLISFYIFIDILVFKNKEHQKYFSTWQFPMLLSIYAGFIYSS